MESVIAWASLAFILIGHAFVRELTWKPDEILSLFKSLFQINSILPKKQETNKTPFLIRLPTDRPSYQLDLLMVYIGQTLASLH